MFANCEPLVLEEPFSSERTLQSTQCRHLKQMTLGRQQQQQQQLENKIKATENLRRWDKRRYLGKTRPLCVSPQFDGLVIVIAAPPPSVPLSLLICLIALNSCWNYKIKIKYKIILSRCVPRTLKIPTRLLFSFCNFPSGVSEEFSCFVIAAFAPSANWNPT